MQFLGQLQRKLKTKPDLEKLKLGCFPTDDATFHVVCSYSQKDCVLVLHFGGGFKCMFFFFLMTLASVLVLHFGCRFVGIFFFFLCAGFTDLDNRLSDCFESSPKPSSTFLMLSKHKVFDLLPLEVDIDFD
ncbi:hypothetical protein LWI28_026126 [Acer negundo]|uniref:Uncharacterized protein n=1 Tax=Acer negundo TaxID=4023 RepID=A0AAD5NZ85_ACENE|nr:hypothetical protein LWI28_026126 [Acer negundo]